MKSLFRNIAIPCSFFALTLCATGQAFAQSATVTLSAQKQYIRGFGGINHAAWAGDMTAAERTLAFGNATGQLGFSVLRIPVTDGNPDAVNVATAKAAIAAGAIVFASPWNASGSTYASAQFAAYATHLNNFVSYMKNQGVDLYAISVQNEPDYGAEGGWGQWTAQACHDFVLNYGATITTRLVSCESFNYAKSYYDPILNDSAALANVDIFGTHLYGTPVSGFSYPLFDSKGAGKERWMTEHYTDSTSDANAWPNALGVASEIHNSMVTAQFNAYVWWYIKRSYGFINNGAVTKRGYCIGQWSKFVRPGFYRVDATASPASGLALSAYKGDSSVVIVVVNTNSSAKTLSISIPGSTLSSFSQYTTSSSKGLANDGTVSASNGALSVSLDASSVTTFVGTGAPSTGGNSGTGGTPSTGGSGTGGVSSSGGTAGSSGAPNTGGARASGGSSGAGGNASSGGSKASGGAAGMDAGGSPTAGGSATTGGMNSANTGGSPLSLGGSAAGGSPGSGGSSPGAGGSPTTGGTFPTTGGTVANGGAVAAAGTSGAVNAGAGNNGEAPADAAGCGCRVAGDAGQSSHSNALALLGMFSTLAFAWRRRRTQDR